MPRYPDPDLVVRPTTAPPRFPLQLVSKNWGKLYPVHFHCAAVDVNGNGTTTVEASHFHRVSRGRVMPDESDGHIHNLTGLPCGAG